MSAPILYSIATVRSCLVGTLLLAGGTAWAQESVPATASGASVWQYGDWLQSAEDQKRAEASGEKFTASSTQDFKDPFTVIANGSLWQEKYDAIYTRRLAETLSLNCETSAVTMGDASDDLSRGQKVGLTYQPMSQLTLRCDLHDSMSDATLPSESYITKGAGFSAQGKLPFGSVVAVGASSDQGGLDTNTGVSTTTDTYNAQVDQPLGKLPLTAELKGSFLTTSNSIGQGSSLPSLEQSLVWKPLQDTTVQMGLRQQHYQEYPGIDNQLNEALFADWSQKIVPDVTWHSYAEMLNTRSLTGQAPASSIASGSNGTPQATTPQSSLSLNSAVPVSLEDQTLTFSTGPSFRLQKDISASVEYSNRWDKNPAPGSVGQEQRVSISLKGTF